ncbi:MAG: hypothetical protein AAF675_20495 [Pseudomonadota bacterium]
MIQPETRFFRFLWRLNAILIAVASLGAILVTVIVALVFLSELTRGRPVQSVVALQRDAGVRYDDLNWGLPEFGPGQIMRVPLMRDQEIALGLASKASRGNTVDIVFVDLESGQKRRLLAPRKGLVLRQIALPPRQMGSAEAYDVEALLFVIVTEDRSGDGRLTRSDPAEVLLTSPDGVKRVAIADDVLASSVQAHISGDDRIGVSFTAQGVLTVLDVDTRTLETQERFRRDLSDG